MARDIRDILSDNIADDAKTAEIYDALFSDGGDENRKKLDEPITIDNPKNITVYTNGSVDNDAALQAGDLITKAEGKDRLKKSGASLRKPDWGLGNKEASIAPLLKKVRDFLGEVESEPVVDKEALDGYRQRVVGRFEKMINGGIVDWTEWLSNFLVDTRRKIVNGPIKKNLLRREGIRQRYRYTVSDYGKCIFYIDTSGSVNNEQTQLIPLMVSEIGNICDQCEFDLIDINLFSDKVYLPVQDIEPSTIKAEDFSIQGVESGGTSINSVYDHIVENYTEDGDIDSDVSCIVIISDYSGLADKSHSSIAPYRKAIGEEGLEKMGYIVYTDGDESIEKATKMMKNTVAKESIFTVVSLDDFRRALKVYESNETKYMKTKKRHTLNEIARTKTAVQAAKQSAVRDIDDTEENRVLLKSKLDHVRRSGEIDEYFPAIGAAIKDNFDSLSIVSSVDELKRETDTYYLNDDLSISIHVNIDDSNIKNVCDLSKATPVTEVYGDVKLCLSDLEDFNPEFPKVLNGNIEIVGMKNLKSLDNFFQTVNGEVYVMSVSEDVDVDAWEDSLSGNVTVQKDRIAHMMKVLKLHTILGGDSDSANESVNTGRKKFTSLLEIARSKSAVAAAKQNATKDLDDMAEERVLVKSRIDTVRESGEIDEYFPNLYEALMNINGDLTLVGSQMEVARVKDTVHISDNLDDLKVTKNGKAQVYTGLHIDINTDITTKEMVDALIELCKDFNVDTLYGNLSVVNNKKIVEFPMGFPKTVKGLFTIRGCNALEDYTNAPMFVTKANIRNTNYLGYRLGNKASTDASAVENAYINTLKTNGAVIISMKNNTSESVNQAEVDARVNEGLDYISTNKLDEEFFFPRRNVSDTARVPYHRFTSGSGDATRSRRIKHDEDYVYNNDQKEIGYRTPADKIANTQEGRDVYVHNTKLFKEYVYPKLGLNYSDVMDNPDVVIDRFDNYTDIAGQESMRGFEGMRAFVDRMGRMTAFFYCENGVANIIFMAKYDKNGNVSYMTSNEEVLAELNTRVKEFVQMRDELENNYGLDSRNLGRTKDLTLEVALVNLLYGAISNKLGSQYGQQYTYTDKVLCDDLQNQMSIDDVVKIMSSIFDTSCTRGKDRRSSMSVYIPEKGTVNMDGKPNNRQVFRDYVMEELRSGEFNVASFFNDDFLAMLLSCAKYNGFGEEIENDPNVDQREWLEDAIYSLRNTNIREMMVGNQTIRSKQGTKDLTSLPMDVMRYFPEYCVEEIRVNLGNATSIKAAKQANKDRRTMRRRWRAGDVYAATVNDRYSEDKPEQQLINYCKYLAGDIKSNYSDKEICNILRNENLLNGKSYKTYRTFADVLRTLTVRIDAARPEVSEEEVEKIVNDIDTNVYTPWAEIITADGGADLASKNEDIIDAIENVYISLGKLIDLDRNDVMKIVSDASKRLGGTLADVDAQSAQQEA